MSEKKQHWLLGNRKSTRLVKILRWVARLWGLVAFVFLVAIFVSPDPHAVNPITLREGFMLSLWALTFLALILAWRWERLGALIAIILLPVRELLYILFYREWTINFLMIWAVVLPPAVMFLIAWHSDQKRNGPNQETEVHRF